MTKTIPNLQKLIKGWKFNHVSPDITDDLFPVPKEISSDYKLFNFDRAISSEDAVNEMAREGYRPANLYELLSWKDWNDKDWVVALGSVGEVRGYRLVPYLYRHASNRCLLLRWWGGDWLAFCRFLACKVDSKYTKVIESKHETCKHKINYCPDCGEKIL